MVQDFFFKSMKPEALSTVSQNLLILKNYVFTALAGDLSRMVIPFHEVK